MDITLTNLQRKAHLNSVRTRRVIHRILRHAKIRHADLSVVIVSRQKMRALNKKYLGRDHETDVLAFPLEFPSLQKGKKVFSGEIIVSADAAFSNANNYHTTLSREIVLYLIHGILHLLGYDDHKAADIRAMREKEKYIFERLGNAVDKCAH